MHTETQLSKVLIVDDEEAVLRILKVMLSKAGFDVTTASSGSEALKIMERHLFDCVVTDSALPLMSGYDLVRTLRKRRQHSKIPVVMLSRQRSKSELAKALEAGVSDYVLKPIDEDLLIHKVQTCIERTSNTSHVFSLPISGSITEAQIGLKAQVTEVSESVVIARSGFELPVGAEIHLASNAFREARIAAPKLKITHCEERKTSQIAGSRKTYELRLEYVGLKEIERMKLRAWLHKEALLRKK